MEGKDAHTVATYHRLGLIESECNSEDGPSLVEKKKRNSPISISIAKRGDWGSDAGPTPVRDSRLCRL